MFGRSKPTLFEPYGRRRARFPRWLLLLLVGIAIGVGGVVYVQERYLPPRLSADASVKLRDDFERADAERLRLAGDLDVTRGRLETALAESKTKAEALSSGLAGVERLRDDLAFAIDALPPDPRGGSVEVRAGRFSAKDGALAYDVVLTRERASGKAFTGVLQFTVAGDAARGGASTITLKPIAVSIGKHEILHGSMPLPDGFRPRQVTIQVLDRAAGQQLGMRVLLVS